MLSTPAHGFHWWVRYDERNHVASKSGHGMNFDNTKFLIIFRFCLFVVQNYMRYVNSGSNMFWIWTITLIDIVAPCDLWLVIAYARTIGHNLCNNIPQSMSNTQSHFQKPQITIILGNHNKKRSKPNLINKRKKNWPLRMCASLRCWQNWKFKEYEYNHN